MEKRASLVWTLSAYLVLNQLVSTVRGGGPLQTQWQALDCSEMSIGVENKDIIPDSSFSASSYYSSLYMPWYGRLGQSRPWATKRNNDSSDYLQIDLGKPFTVCGVKTQGTAYTHMEWVTTFKLMFSLDGKKWETYKQKGKEKVFIANSDDTSVVTNSFADASVLARYIRFVPVTYHKHKTMRVAVFGIWKTCNKQIQNPTPKYIPDSSYSASNIYDCRYQPWRARLFSVIGWAPITNNDPNDYLQLDLGEPYSTCAIGTQGSAKHGEWVTSFKLSFSNDSTTWKVYQENRKDKNFPGNSKYRNILLVQYITPTVARFVRFIPVGYVGHKTMRVGVFGHNLEDINGPSVKISKEKMEPLVKACIGDNVTISCYATGSTPIKYSWSMNGSDVIDKNVVNQVSNVLIVKPKTAKHFGTYICRAYRGLASDSYSIELRQIMNCPEQTGKLRFVPEKMTSLVQADMGIKIILACFAISSRPIEYSWTKDSRLISASNTTAVIDNVATIHTTTKDDYGIFVCSVTDGKHVITYPITLKPFDHVKTSVAASRDEKTTGSQGKRLLTTV
ncbi:Lactadherin [Exaiptasia diaphana]|nr:Lactadherin [Exaiptasia diaphana]